MGEGKERTKVQKYKEVGEWRGERPKELGFDGLGRIKCKYFTLHFAVTENFPHKILTI